MYSLGVIFFYLLIGMLLFIGENVDDIFCDVWFGNLWVLIELNWVILRVFNVICVKVMVL